MNSPPDEDGIFRRAIRESPLRSSPKKRKTLAIRLDDEGLRLIIR